MIKFNHNNGRKIIRMIKILHCADFHIGAADSTLGSIAEKRRVEAVLSFEKVIDIAKENEIKLIAIAGDLFDSNSCDPSFVDTVLSKIASVPEIKVVFAAGNHDPLDSLSPFTRRSLPENLFVLPETDSYFTFDDLKIRVYGRSFSSATLQGEPVFSLLPPKDDYINLLVQHGDLKSDLKSDYNAITPRFVKESGMDYIALGHIHKRSDALKLGNTYFAYCGCPEGQGFDELDQKGVYIAEIGKGSCTLEFVPVSFRIHAHEKIDISNCFTPAEIAACVLSVLKEKYGEDYRKNIYKIVLTGAVAENAVINLSEISARLVGEVFYAKVKDSTTLAVDFEELSKEASLKGIFVKNMLSRIEKAQGEEKEFLLDALNLGLRAFLLEVKFDEAE